MSLSLNKYILTITPNPTLDLGGIVEEIKPNEKNYVRDQTKSPGGNGINAARILTRLGIPTLASGFLGGSIGEEIKFLLDQEEVKSKFISIQGHSRISVTVSRRRDHQQTRLTFSGPTISVKEKKLFLQHIKDNRRLGFLVLGGSFPEGFEISDAKRILKVSREKNISCIVDCPGSLLRELLNESPFMIKPNLIEFQEALDFHGQSLSSVLREGKKLLARVSYVCVSSVEGGSLLITQEGSYFGRIPQVKILSTVGAGDSMVGAMGAQFFTGNQSAQDILRWGLAAAAATLSHPGTALGTAKEIKQLYQKTKVKKVE